MTEINFKRNLAVVIGINEYQNGISRLKTAVPDAIKIANILKQSYQYQLIHPDLKTEAILDRDATIDRFRTLFTQTLPQQIQPNKSDRLLVYFAGHGIARNSDTGPEGYLIPQDGNTNDPNSLLRMGDVRKWLSQLECRHLLVILDCCFAGTFRWGSSRKLIPIPEKIHWEHYYRFIKYPAWQVIASAAHNQEALDFLNNRDDETIREHSPFAEGLIKALDEGQADLSADGVITTPELYLYLRDYVEINSRERQTPGFFPLEKHDRGEYIFQLPNIEPKLEPAPPLDKDNNPYRGLESFEEKHSRFFFGRQQLIEALFEKVTQIDRQLTIVLGISGSGKSSLVKAGLIPYLRQQEGEKWHILDPIRLGTNPVNALNSCLSQVESIETWSKQNPNTRLLLVIDQFEELITLAQKTIAIPQQLLTWRDKLKLRLGLSIEQIQNPLPSEEKSEQWQEFLVLLADLLKSCPQLSLILTLRSDFEPRFLNSALKSDWANARFIVRPMLSYELRDAVEKPANEMALYFEPANLVDRIVDEVAQMPSALPLLSFTLSEMYINLHRAWLEEGKEDRSLTVAANFDRQSGVASSLTRSANREYHNLPDRAHRLTMRRIMLRMVEVEGGEAVRRRVTKKELEYTDPAENERVVTVLDSLDRSRLIVGGDEAGEAYVEPAHDFLVRGWDRLQEWLQKAQKDDNLNLQRLLTPAAFDWQREAKSPQFLWNANPRLDLLSQIWRSPDNWFNRVETEFVRSSIARKKFNVRLRWGIAIAVITLLSAGLAIALIGQRNAKIGEANAAKQSARVNLVSRQALEPMLDSLRAGTSLKHPLLALFQPTSQLLEQIRGTLQWSVYQVAEVNRMQGDPVPVRSIFNAKGNAIASGEENGKIRIWNLEGEELKVWQADPQRVWNLVFSHNRNLLASAGQSGTISLWDLQGNKLRSWQAYKGQIRDLSFSPNDRVIASAGGEDGIINLWNLQGDELASWQAHKEMVKSVSLSPDGKLIATSGSDLTIRIWDLRGHLIKQFPVHAWKVVFSPDGKLIASAGDDGFIHLWNEKYELIKLWRGDNQRLWNIAFSPDSQTIASAGEDGSAKIWDLQGKKLHEFSGHTGPARRVSFSPDGKLLSSSGDDGTTRLWSLEDKELAAWQGDRNSVNDLVFSPDGKVLVSGGQDNSIHFWDLKNLPKENQINNSSERDRTFSQSKLGIQSISISSDGKLLVTANDNGIVRIWDVQARSSRQLATQLNFIQTVLISPDDRIIAIAGGNGSIELWDLQGQFITQLSGHTDIVYSLSFSPDSKLLASASKDGTVITWDWQKQKQVKKFQDHIGEVFSVAFSPIRATPFAKGDEGGILASGGQDGTIRLWNVLDNSTQSPFHVYEAQVRSIVFTPDGKQIISSDDRGYIQLWDVESRESLVTWQADRTSINSISLNPEGNLLATASASGQIKLWRIDSFDRLLSQVCDRLGDYLQHNSTVEKSDRSLCKNTNYP